MADDISWVKKDDKYLVNKDSSAHGARLTTGDILKIQTTRYERKGLDASVYIKTVGETGKDWVISPKVLLDVCTKLRDVQVGDVYTADKDFGYSGAKVKKGTVLTVRKPTVSYSGSFMVGALAPTGRSDVWSINSNSILANCTLHTEGKESKPKVKEEVKPKVSVKRLDQKDFMSALDGI